MRPVHVHPKFALDAARGNVVAGILVGGRSRRMGQPKALLKCGDGTTFVEHVASAARAVAEEVVLLGRTSDIPDELSTMTMLPDAACDAGPLAGLLALLQYAVNRWSLLLACDLPNLQPDLLRELCASAHPSVDAVAYVQRRDPLTYHACCAAYGPGMLDVVARHVRGSELRLQSALNGVRVAELTPNRARIWQLANVNSPEDLTLLHHAG